MSRKFRSRQLALPVLLGVVLSSCMSLQNGGTLDQIAGALTSPIVEGYIEYPGPHAKWAGPQGFVMHIDAKGTGNAKLSVVPALIAAPAAHPTNLGKVGAHRTLASEPVVSNQGVPAEVAREILANLGSSIGHEEPAFRGCLSPVRIRLIRANGALIERQGCRGQGGWAKTASETVNRFVTAHLHGMNAPLTSTVNAEIEQ
jgi:hypothetical protein